MKCPECQDDMVCNFSITIYSKYTCTRISHTATYYSDGVYNLKLGNAIIAFDGRQYYCCFELAKNLISISPVCFEQAPIYLKKYLKLQPFS